MAPVKFDDIPKGATEVLNDDYQVSGYQFKAKQKTSFNGAIATTAVDMFTGAAVQTPAKITWKLPKPLGVAGLCVDKLEVDKAGKMALEVSADKASHKVDGLTLTAKSDLVAPEKAVAALTYTGIKDMQIKFDTKPLNISDFTLEVTRAVQRLTFGAKCGMNNLTAPDVGARFSSGPFFLSLTGKEQLGKWGLYGSYKATDALKLAGSFEFGAQPKYCAGLSYEVVKGTKLRAKVLKDKEQALCASLKHELSKGFTVLAGGKFEPATGKSSIGVQLSVE
eukprot:CAMPEP_0117567042 /NCGR_PEP_ID=MMETSP0784-20121206/57399_1 /TAXON_ID=39447 /ORGANISM="" /LENGTH=278 /DNA_ID=CAMNT_0005364893 /DNA_START=91 /DNA_END=927 /DNA_ORIENTATION=-